MNSEKKIKIAIAGAKGRMGHMLIEATLSDPQFVLCGALVKDQSAVCDQIDAAAFLGKKTDVYLSHDAQTVIAQADVLIDFSTPAATMNHLEIASHHQTKMVIGTTGFSLEQKELIKAFGEKLPIVFSPNMSLGVNLIFKILQQAAAIIPNHYDIEITEAHHRNKVDAPSGTALKMGEILAAEYNRNFDDCAVYDRHGVTGKREDHAIGFSTIRGGDIVGEHHVFFIGKGERIEIAHRSTSRYSYAQGSLLAAQFLVKQPNGLYDMQQVLENI